MSWKAACSPSFNTNIEMSWAVPGNRPVSDRYWTIDCGPNHIRCRGNCGRSS
jgi:hypothetical protein